MTAINLVKEVVTATKYVLNEAGFSKAYVSASPTGGTCLVEVTCAPLNDVRLVAQGGVDANVLWEPWTAGAAAVAAFDTVDAPWTALRITATNSIVNIAGEH